MISSDGISNQTQPQSIESSKLEGNNKVAATEQTDELLAQSAVNETGFGKFNYKILTVCVITFMNTGLCVLSISFVLPAASCDFQMTTEEKGTLTAMPMFGMLVGSYFWGCLADTKGRKTSLMFALYLQGGIEFIASFVPIFPAFLALKFVSGFAVCGQITVVFTYLAEFQPAKYRDLFLSWMEMAWVVGILLSACVAWAIIPLNIEYKFNLFFFHSWNMFVLICSLPALTIGTSFLFLPETPKYLAETGQNVKMFNVLAKMYSENTGKPASDYFKQLTHCDNTSLKEIAQRVSTDKDAKEDQNIQLKTLGSIFRNVLLHTLDILKKPYLRQTLTICTAMFITMSPYYMLVLWFPLLFQRYNDFNDKHPDQSVTVCRVMSERTNATVQEIEDTFGCDLKIQTRVYVYSIILGLSCIPCGVCLPLLINRLGYIFFWVASTSLAAVATLCMFLVGTSVQILVVSCFFEALSSVSNTIICCVVVHLYPTHLRSIAAGLASTFSRLGAIVGNLLTGWLIDSYCTWVIILVVVQLLMSSILGYLVSRSKCKEEKK